MAHMKHKLNIENEGYNTSYDIPTSLITVLQNLTGFTDVLQMD